MLKLLKVEFKKYKRSYINSLSFIGMLIPIILAAGITLIKKDTMLKYGHYTWEDFNSYVETLITLLLGPAITSFIATLTISYEYQQDTMKKILVTPYSRNQVLASKILYVCLFVVLQYLSLYILDVALGFAFGFDMTPELMKSYFTKYMITGLSTLVLVPLVMFLTLITKTLLPALVLTIIGAMSNVVIMEWDKAFLSPWFLPINLSFGLTKHSVFGEQIKIHQPITSFIVYFALFTILSFIYFNKSDQTN